MGCSLTLVDSSMNLSAADHSNIEDLSHKIPHEQDSDSMEECDNTRYTTLTYNKTFFESRNSPDSGTFGSPLTEPAFSRRVTIDTRNPDYFESLSKTSSGMKYIKSLTQSQSIKLRNMDSLKPRDNNMLLKHLTTLEFNEIFTFKKHVNDCEENFLKDYIFCERIGKGAGGEAFKVFHKPTNQFRVAKTARSKPDENASHLKKRIKRLADEANLISELDHPNIVKVHEVFKKETEMTVIMEYVEGEDLYKNINNPAFESLNAIATIIEQILSALVYLHGKGIVHKDLKLQNVVLEKANPYSNLKLIDFGFSELEDKPETRNRAGTVAFMSPEVIRNQHDTKCDIWATGVILYYLLFKELPFVGNNTDELIDNISRQDLSQMFEEKQNLCEALLAMPINFLRRLIERDPVKRYSAAEALKDPFIQNYAQKPKTRGSDVKLLKKYQEKTIMELVLPSVFVHHLMKPDEKAEFIRVFRALDKNRKGFITYEDLKKLDSSLEDKFNIEDDGLEFTKFMIACVDTTDTEILRRIFTYLDKNHDMTIKLEDILQVLKDYIARNVLEDIRNFFHEKEGLKIIVPFIWRQNNFRGMSKIVRITPCRDHKNFSSNYDSNLSRNFTNPYNMKTKQG